MLCFGPSSKRLASLWYFSPANSEEPMTPHPSDKGDDGRYEALCRSYFPVQYRQEPPTAAPYHDPGAPSSRVAIWPTQNTWSPSQQHNQYEYQQHNQYEYQQRQQELHVGGTRILSLLESAGDDAHQSFGWSQESPPAPQSSRKKQRRPSHVINQEAKQSLSEQLRHLEIQKMLFQQEKGIVDPIRYQAALEYNATLRDAILHQRLLIAATQSAFSGFSTSQASSPLETFIHLTHDQSQRRRALFAMRDRKLNVAVRFLTQRTLHVGQLRKSYEVSQFETSEGDICIVKMDVTPIDGATSVRQVYEALQSYLASSDATITTLTGTGDSSCEDGRLSVMQHRLVTTAEQCGALVEHNLVLFLDGSRLDSDNVEEQYAVIAQDFVDRDDLHPYCSAQRLRQDVTSVMKLSAHCRPVARNSSSLSAEPRQQEDEEEWVVVLTRWAQLRLRKPEIHVPSRALQSVADDMLQGLDHVIQSIREQVGAA